MFHEHVFHYIDSDSALQSLPDLQSFDFQLEPIQCRITDQSNLIWSCFAPQHSLQNSSPVPSDPLVLCWSSRPQRAPDYLKELHCNMSTSASSISSSLPGNEVILCIHCLLSFLILSISPTRLKYTLAISDTSEPKTYAQVVKCENWIQATSVELQVLRLTKYGM